jgi:hypothetical protein
MTIYYIQSDSYAGVSWKDALRDILYKGKKTLWLGDEYPLVFHKHYTSVAQHFTSTMSTTTTPDNGKRYNIWTKMANRWTNSKIGMGSRQQDPLNPRRLTYDQAVAECKLLNAGYGSNPDFEVRELPDEDPTNPGIKKPAVKSAGMNCSGQFCNEFNPYAEANSNGKYFCYSCRKR